MLNRNPMPSIIIIFRFVEERKKPEKLPNGFNMRAIQYMYIYICIQYTYLLLATNITYGVVNTHIETAYIPIFELRKKPKKKSDWNENRRRRRNEEKKLLRSDWKERLEWFIVHTAKFNTRRRRRLRRRRWKFTHNLCLFGPKTIMHYMKCVVRVLCLMCVCLWYFCFFSLWLLAVVRHTISSDTYTHTHTIARWIILQSTPWMC